MISSQLGKKPPFSIPFGFAKLMVSVRDLMGNKAPINFLKLKKLQNHSLSLTKKQKAN
jgi:hypothetical protein